MIYKKLLEFQKKSVKLTKDSSNPFFKSKYVSLNEVLGKIQEPLSELGVVIVQMPQENGLLTRLVDTEDDTFVEGFMPYVGATDAQKLGSCNTYNRRYSLVSLLSLGDQDDDGNTASAVTPKKKEQDKIVDGDYTIQVFSQKEGETNGISWTAVETNIGRLWNNSGYELEDGKTYDVQIMKQSIWTARPAIMKK